MLRIDLDGSGRYGVVESTYRDGSWLTWIAMRDDRVHRRCGIVDRDVDNENRTRCAEHAIVTARLPQFEDEHARADDMQDGSLRPEPTPRPTIEFGCDSNGIDVSERNT